MKQRFGMVTAFLALSLLLFHFVFHPTYAGEWQPLSTAMEDGVVRRPILLVPLDSRPPCGAFVVNGGKIKGGTTTCGGIPCEIQNYHQQNISVIRIATIIH